MIDITREQVFSLCDAPRYTELPRRRFAKRPHVSTFFRWAKRGVRGVRLETIRIGGTLCTSVNALQRFFVALSGPDSQQRTPTPADKCRHSEQVDSQLDREGF
jgi:hypothetical protein